MPGSKHRPSSPAVFFEAVGLQSSDSPVECLGELITQDGEQQCSTVHRVADGVDDRYRPQGEGDPSQLGTAQQGEALLVVKVVVIDESDALSSHQGGDSDSDKGPISCICGATRFVKP